MNSCLYDMIGLWLPGVASPPAPPIPESGLYINKDLPLSLDEINSLTDQEQATFYQLWAEIQTRGIRKFSTKVKSAYREMFKECFTTTDEWFCENKTNLQLPLLYFLGMELMLEKQFTTRINRFTRSFDIQRARELYENFSNEFYEQLADALKNIGHVEDKACDTGTFIYIEQTP